MIRSSYNDMILLLVARLHPDIVIGVERVPIQRVGKGAGRYFERHRVAAIGGHLGVQGKQIRDG